MRRRRLQILIGGFLLTASLGGAAPFGEWQVLFNGTNLAGWKVQAKVEDQAKNYWRVADGCLVADSLADPNHDYVWLETEREFGDFELRLKFQAFRDSPGNSGVQIRSRYDTAAGWLDGPQIDIHPAGPWRTGFIYDETRGVQKWIAPSLPKVSDARPEMAVTNLVLYYSDDSPAWNELEITALGPHVRVVLNGVVVREYNGAGVLDDAVHRQRQVGMRGHLALQIHRGDRLKLRFKDLSLRDLSRATGEATNPGTRWPAMDALGRRLPVGAGVTTPRPGRFVGMFYFLWHDQVLSQLPKDLAKLLPQDPDLLQKPDSPLWGPPGASYYWGEPLYGYYNSKDAWVLRRHAQLLADAGIDVVIFDTTNRRTYPDVYSKLCEVWAQVRQEGGRTPQICFMVNTRAGETAQEIYRDLYQPGRFPELWFVWQGRPLLICDPAEASAEVKEFFTLRKAHWPFELVNTHNAWHWESTYPQVYSYDDDPAKAEQVNVAVAQNLRAEDGKVTNMSEGNARGRSFHQGKQNIAPGSVAHGYNFAEQWQRAIELDPPFVMVTGWNEWIAGKFSRPGLPVVFVDQFDQEFSRDIEPVTGLHHDNYYYQLVANVRRYKGAPTLPVASAVRSIDLAGGFEQWRDVAPEFVDHEFDDDHRDFGQGPVRYQNTSGRNDLARMKVARDATQVYFYAQTRQELTPASGSNWMWLLLDTDQNPQTGWAGYDFILNRTHDGKETWLERNTGGWHWEPVAKLQFTVKGNELMLAVPRAALGLAEGDAVSLDFKWWDNAQKPGEILDTYLSGDVAPEGRFNYRYLSGATQQTRPGN